MALLKFLIPPVFLLLLQFPFQFTYAGSAPSEVKAKVEGEEQDYLVKDIQALKWNRGARAEGSPPSLPLLQPVVKFTLISRAYLDNTVKFGTYCLMLTLRGLSSPEKAKAAQEALSQAQSVTLNPQDFQTDRKQEYHNRAVPERQLTRFTKSYSGLQKADEPNCYLYDIEVDKVRIETPAGKTLSLVAESDIRTLTAELKDAQKDLKENQEVLSVTGGTAAQAEAKKFVDQSQAKVKKLEALLKAQNAGPRVLSPSGKNQ